MFAPRFDWWRRVAWGVVAVSLGVVVARQLFRPNGDAIHGGHVLIKALVLVCVVGVVGGLLLVARSWPQLALTAIGGAAAWSIGFAEAIPKTQVTCGSDAIGDCDHLLGLWILFSIIFSALPVAIPLLASTLALWRLAPSTKALPAPTVHPRSLPATLEQVEWAHFVARAGDHSDRKLAN